MTQDGLVSSVVFSGDGKYLVSGSYDGTVRVWKISTGEEIARMLHESTVYSVAFSPDGRYVLSGSLDKPANSVFEIPSFRLVHRITDIVEIVIYFRPKIEVFIIPRDIITRTQVVIMGGFVTLTGKPVDGRIVPWCISKSVNIPGAIAESKFLPVG